MIPSQSSTGTECEFPPSQSSGDYIPYLPARCMSIEKIRRRCNLVASISTQTSHNEESLKRISNDEFIKILERNKVERMKNKNYEAKLAQLRSDMADIHRAVKELNLARDKQDEKYKNEITKLRSKLETSEEEKRMIKEKFENIQNASAVLHAKFQADIAELNKQLKKAVTENAQLLPQLNKFMTEHADLQEKMMQMRQSLGDYERAQAFMQDAQVEQYSFRQVEIVEDVNENAFTTESVCDNREPMESLFLTPPKLNFTDRPSGATPLKKCSSDAIYETKSSKMQMKNNTVEEDEWSEIEQVLERFSPKKENQSKESVPECNADELVDNFAKEIGELEKYLADDALLSESPKKESPKREYRIRLVEPAEWDEVKTQIDEFREMAETSRVERSRKRKLFLDELTSNATLFKKMYAERKEASERAAGVQLKASLVKAGVSTKRIDEVTKVNKWGYKQPKRNFK